MMHRIWQCHIWLIAFLLFMPFLALLYEASLPDQAIFAQLWDTVLLDYVLNTLILVFLVAVFSLIFGLPVAWLIAMCQFPGRKWLQWAMMLPLAMPAYLIAYVYTDLLDYAGPIQTELRQWFGWQSPDDYHFFAIRSIGGAAIMLALVLFPYLYLIVRTSLVEQSYQLIHASRIMGASPWRSFWRISVPLARGGIVVALALISMETLADFATVHYFAVNTLTTAVYDTWLGYGSLTAAAKLSVVMLGFIFLLLGIERVSRSRQAVYERSTTESQDHLYHLQGITAYMATFWCVSLLFFAFILPMMVLVSYAFEHFHQAWNAAFFRYAGISLSLAILVALLTVVISFMMLAYRRDAQHRSPNKVHQLPSLISGTGYALPGTVLAIGVLIPLSLFDFAINELTLDWWQWQPGLILSGTVVAIIFAYVVRFNAVALGAIDTSFAKISPSIDMVSQTLGLNKLKIMYRIHLPLLAKGCLVAGLLVFIEAMKELPAALLLRPFNFETLATHVYQYVSDEQLELASLAAISIVLVGLVPLIFVNQLAVKR